jgi:hypothetical protein
MRVCSGFTVRDRREASEELGFAQRRKACESGVCEGEVRGAHHGWVAPPTGAVKGAFGVSFGEGLAAPLDCPLRGSIGRR